MCALIYSSSRGVIATQWRHSKFAVICNLDADCTYLRSLLQPAKLRTGKTICFSTSCLDCWRNLNFNEDHVRILLMGSLCTDEGDKFGFHSSLLAQLKTVVLEFHVYLFISSWIRRWWPSTSGVSNSLAWQVYCNENVFLHTRCVPHHNSIKQFEQICV